jgi:hypothetical protein
MLLQRTRQEKTCSITCRTREERTRSITCKAHKCRVVQATRRVETDEQFFALYGTGFGFLTGVSITCVGVMLRRHVANLA